MAGNANSGRRPTPRAIKEARGTTRPDRDGEEGEIVEFETPAEGKTPAPEWLEADALREWRRVVPILEKARVLSVADYSQLANYCVAHGLAVKASKQLKRSGLTVKRANGSVASNPLITIAKEARAQALRIAIEYGLTPAARTRIKPNEDQPDIPGAEGAAGEAEAQQAASFLFAPSQPPTVIPPLKLLPTATKANGQIPEDPKP